MFPPARAFPSHAPGALDGGQTVRNGEGGSTLQGRLQGFLHDGFASAAMGRSRESEDPHDMWMYMYKYIYIYVYMYIYVDVDL